MCGPSASPLRKMSASGSAPRPPKTKFELTAWKPGSGWIILRGRADLDDRVDDDIRRAGYEHLVGLGEYYDGPDDPTLTFFSFTDAEAWVCDIDGSWVPIEL